MGNLRGLGECPLAFGDNTNKRCAWCGEPLPKYRRRWCSDPCGDTWWRNHAWTGARAERLKTDGRACVVCGAKEGDGWRVWLEVNHIHPRRGKGYGNGCHHHQDNLETLCHEHHLAVTALQRAEGYVPRPAAEVLVA